MKFESNYKAFHSSECIWKCHMRNVSQFVQEERLVKWESCLQSQPWELYVAQHHLRQHSVQNEGKKWLQGKCFSPNRVYPRLTCSRQTLPFFVYRALFSLLQFIITLNVCTDYHSLLAFVILAAALTKVSRHCACQLADDCSFRSFNLQMFDEGMQALHSSIKKWMIIWWILYISAINTFMIFEKLSMFYSVLFVQWMVLSCLNIGMFSIIFFAIGNTILYWTYASVN